MKTLPDWLCATVAGMLLVVWVCWPLLFVCAGMALGDLTPVAWHLGYISFGLVAVVGLACVLGIGESA
jgi:hypothetical protein